MDILQMYPLPHPQTAGRVIDGEAILILADASEINVLNPVGARIFELADGTHATNEIIATITAEYEVTSEEATEDVLDFLQDLVDQQILVFSETPEG